MMIRSRFTALVVCAFIALTLPLGAQEGNWHGGSASFELSPVVDIAVGVPALGLFVVGQVLEPSSQPKQAFGWFDEGLSFSYSRGLDLAGDLSALAGLAALPLLLDSWTLGEAATVGTMFAEASMLAWGAKNTLKALVGRPRPNLSWAPDGTPVPGQPDPYESFPSGHTTIAFMIASFVTTVYAEGPADPAMKWAVGGTTFGLAACTAVLRVLGGQHYGMDVVTGALIGAGAGWVVPTLHKKRAQALVSPSQEGITLAYRLSY